MFDPDARTEWGEFGDEAQDDEKLDVNETRFCASTVEFIIIDPEMTNLTAGGRDLQ
jgi:hypothetical protein